MKRLSIGYALAALAAVVCPVSATWAQWSTVNSSGAFSWNDAPWSTGAPPTSAQTGLLKGAGTITIDASSTQTAPGGLLIGWDGSFNMAMTGGTLTVGNVHGDPGVFGLTVGESVGYGTFTQSAGTVTSPVVNLARNGAPSGTYSLNGGFLETSVIQPRNKAGSGTATLNLGGGTLRATASGGGWIAGGIVMNVQAGGAIIDTQNYDVTVLSPLLDGGGGGGLTMSGSTAWNLGVLRLGAASTYTGPTNVNAGYLVTNVNHALPVTTVVNLHGVAGQVSRMDLRSTTQKIAGLTSAAGATGTIDIYSGGGTAGVLEVDVAFGDTYTFHGAMGSGDPSTRAFQVVKSGQGTQVLVGQLLHTGGTQVAGGTLQIGNNDGWNYVGAAGHQYTVDSGAQLVFHRNFTPNDFTSQSITGEGDVVFRGQQTGYFRFINSYSGTLSYTGKTIVNLDTGGTEWYMGYLFLEKDNVLPNATVVDLQSGKIDLRNQTGNGLTIAGLQGSAATSITATLVGGQKLNVDVADGNTYTYAGTIQGGITVTKSGLGTQILSGDNSYSGGTTISGGTLAIGGSGSLASAVNLSATGAVLDISGLAADSTSIGSLAGVAGSSVVLGSKRLISGANNATTGFAGGISGNGELTKTGTGTLTLSGANTYTGGTLVDMGFLQLDADNALGSGVLSFGGATARASLNMNGRNQTVRGLVAPNAAQYRGDVYNNAGNPTSTLTIDTPAGETYVYANQIGAASGWLNVAVVKRGPGTQVFTGNNTYTGGTTVAGGTLQFGSNSPSGARPPGLVTLQNGANLALSHNYDYGGISLPNTTGNGNLVLLGQGSGYYSLRPETATLNYTGTTTLELDSQSGGTWRGALFVEPGSVGLPSTTVLNIVSGKLDLRQNQTIAGLTGSGGFVTTDGGFTPSLIIDFPSTAGPFTYGGVIGRPPGTGSWENTPHVALEKRGTGTQILTGHHNYTGATTVSGGTLAVNGSLPASSTVSVHSGGTLSGTGTIGGPVSILGSGMLAPGMSVGTLSLSGNLTFGAGAWFDVDIADVGIADLVQMAGGTLTPGGAAIRVNLLDGFMPDYHQSWTIVQDEGFIAGTFNPEVLVWNSAASAYDTTFGGHKWFEVRYGNSVVLTVVPEPGTWLLLLSALVCGLLVRRPR